MNIMAKRFHPPIALGRPLKENEVVHHIDENIKNNTPNNLLICTRSYHTRLHAKMRRIENGTVFANS